MNLLLGDRHMFDTLRHNSEFALAKVHFCLMELDQQMSFDHQEQLVFIPMTMPDKFAFQRSNLDVRTIELGKYFRAPVILKFAKFLGEINTFHIFSIFSCCNLNSMVVNACSREPPPASHLADGGAISARSQSAKPIMNSATITISNSQPASAPDAAPII